MAKYKSYNYSQTVMLPVSLENQLMPGTIEFAIHTLVEERMDVSRFDERYSNDETGCKAYDPKIVIKGSASSVCTRDKHLAEDRESVQRECGVHGNELWSGT